MLWLIGLLVVCGLLAFAAGGLIGWGLVLILFGLVAIYISYGLQVIPVAHMGIVVRLGKRTEKVLEEGWALITPFIEDVLLEDFRVHTEEFAVKSLRSRDDAEMFVKIKVSWKPRKSRFAEYIDKRGEEGIRAILEGLSESEVRQYVSTTLWRKVKRSRDNIETLLRDRIEKEIPVIDITILSVMDADLVPGTEIAREADRLAREEVQRRAQLYEMDTILKVADAMQEVSAQGDGPIVAKDDLIRFLMTNEAIREGHGQYHQVGGIGLEQLAREALRAFLESRKPGEKEATTDA